MKNVALVRTMSRANHHALAAFCQAAYADDGIPGGRIIGAQGAQCHVLYGDDGHTLVIFRGTNDAAGWLDNLDMRWRFFDEYSLRSGSPGIRATAWSGHVHAGFLTAWHSLKRQVLDAVGVGTRLIFTGHSMGGAVATLAGADLRGRTSGVVTFGAPRVGDATFAREYSVCLGANTTRYVHGLDPVAWLPGVLAGFRHVVPPRWWNGTAWQDGLGLWRWGVAAAKRLFIGRERLWADHAIQRYVEALQP